MELENRKIRRNVKKLKNNKINKHFKRARSPIKEQYSNFGQDRNQQKKNPCNLKNDEGVLLEKTVEIDKIKERIAEFKKKYDTKYLSNKILYPDSNFKTTLTAPFLNDKEIPEVVKNFIFSSEFQEKKTDNTVKSVCEDIKNLLFELETFGIDPICKENDSSEDLVLLIIKNTIPEFQSIIGFAPQEFREFSVKPKWFLSSSLTTKERTRYDVLQDIKNLLSQYKKALKNKANPKTAPVSQRRKTKTKKDKLNNLHPRFQMALTEAYLENNKNEHNYIPFLPESKKKRDIKDVLDDLKHFLPNSRTASFDGRFADEQYEEYLRYEDDNHFSLTTPRSSRQNITTDEVLEEVKELIPELKQMQAITKSLMNTDGYEFTKTELSLDKINKSSTTGFSELTLLQKDIGLEKIDQLKSWLKRRDILINNNLEEIL